MRHAKSSWKDSTLPDRDRPLNKRGVGACRLMGTLLREKGLIPDKIICSTALRARETVEGLLEVLSIEEVEYSDALYQAEVEDMIEQLQGLPDEIESVMLVGHNPGMDEFLDVICHEQEHMPTAAVAEIEFNLAHWQQLTEDIPATLKKLWMPKEIQA